ncbi:hypothetical protein ACFL6S_14345 [Candidatus Poribacteria bacterium]
MSCLYVDILHSGVMREMCCYIKGLWWICPGYVIAVVMTVMTTGVSLFVLWLVPRHSEQSEESLKKDVILIEILRFAQNDKSVTRSFPQDPLAGTVCAQCDPIAGLIHGVSPCYTRQCGTMGRCMYHRRMCGGKDLIPPDCG